jgi:hypothetical protein
MDIPEDSKRLVHNDMGLYDKYTVMRNDMQDMIGGKHYLHMHFVLDMNCDPHAREVLLHYAALIESKKPNLARDIREWFAQQELDNSTAEQR